MRYSSTVEQTINLATEEIREKQHVAMHAIPALIHLLRDIADASAEHASGEALSDQELCSDEVNAYHFAKVLLGEDQ